MESKRLSARTVTWSRLSLCAALSVAGLVGWVVADPPADVISLAPDWLPLAAAVVAAASILAYAFDRTPPRVLVRVLTWSGLLLLVWTASGLPLDLLRLAGLLVPGLMPSGVDWAGLATRLLAFAVFIGLARLAFARPTAPVRMRGSSWYGYAALALALVYPILKTCWALGGDLGLRWPGADGLAGSFVLWLPAVPWLLAAAVSLLLVRTPRRMPRRLLLVAGWSATAVVATFGPAACWSLVAGLIGDSVDFGAMEGWVYGVIYGSWFLWAIAAGAATRAYQLRSARTS